MHKGIIILVKADGIEDARCTVDSAMCEQQYGSWSDWFEVGGRWTGELDGYNPNEDPKNLETCTLCNGTGLRNDELGKKAREENPDYTCNGCSGKGKSVKWSYNKHDNDSMALKDCIDTVKEWGKDLTKDAHAELKKGLEKIEEKNYSTAGYYLRNAGELFSQNFCPDCNVFNAEEYNYSIPEDTEGWYAVIIDCHY